DAEAQEEQRSKCGGPAHELCLDRERLGPKPLGVLLLVVAAVLAGPDRLPPGAVRRVPLDRLGQPALAEGVARRPAERAQLPVVERVTAVVSRAILDVADQRRVGPRQLEDPVGHLEVLVVLAADVVDLAGRALAQHELDAGAVVLGVQPLAHLLPVAVDRERLALEGVRDEERHELLGVLVRAEGVRTAGDRGAYAVRPHVGEHLEVAPRLRGAVGAGGPQRIVLERTPPCLEIAVDLVRRHLDVPRVVRASPLEQRHRAEHVRVDELLRPEDRAVDVRLRGEIDDGLAGLPGALDGLRVGDVADDEIDPGPLQIGGIAGVRELVEDDDVVAARDQPSDEVRADEAGAAGDEHAHRGRVVDAREPIAFVRRTRVVAAYRFVDEWLVPASPEWVYGLLSCPREYPEWWGDAFLEGEGDPGPAAPGKRARLLTRGRLPYRLR